MKRLTLLFAALLGAALVGGPVRAAPAVTSELVPAAGFRIDVPVGQGQLVHILKPVDSVFVADPDIADIQVKSPTLVYVIGKAAGTTTLYAVTAQDNVVLNTEVRVHFDAERVAQAIHELVPQSAVTVSAVADSLVLTGTVNSPADDDSVRRIAARFVKDPKQLVNNTKVDAPTQISLRVRVAEVSRNIVKQFGINWQNVFSRNNGAIIFGIASGAPALITGATGLVPQGPVAAGAGLPGGPAFGTGAGFNGFNTFEGSQLGGQTNNNLFAGGRTGNVNLNTLIDALDNHGLVTVLAEPNLTAVSGEPANFLAGGEFPVPVPAGQGLVGIDWKNFGVSLNFVATITSGSRISLHVMPEVSELSTQGAIIIDGISVPSLTTRRAETTVELASGQSFAIAGLLQNNVTQNINKFPWLGDVPMLGQLFRSEAFQRNESELVILVTPYIVHPIETASRALLPTDGYAPASDGQLIYHGAEYQQHPPAAPAANGAGTLIGPVGFDLQ